jgi:hypothetical protein
MVYDVSMFIAERDRLIGELNWFNQQPETVNKRNEINNRMLRINQLEDMINRSTLQRQFNPNNQYQPYTYQQPNISPYVNQSQLPPMGSLYQESYTNRGIGYSPYSSNQTVTTNSRYANKPLPNDRYKNDNYSNYRVETVKKEEPKPIIKKYISNSRYPLICKFPNTEIERQLETGYYEREVEAKESVDKEEVILEKTDTLIKSKDDFYDIFSNKLNLVDIEKTYAYAFYNALTFGAPVIIQDDVKLRVDDIKELTSKTNSYEDITEACWNIQSFIMGLFKPHLVHIGYYFGTVFNNILKYGYNGALECDNFVDDIYDIIKEINGVSIVKDKQKYIDVLTHIMSLYNNADIELLNDNTFIKIRFKIPTLVVTGQASFALAKASNPIFTLRKTSYGDLYQLVDNVFNHFGDQIKNIDMVVLVSDQMKREYSVYSFGTGADKQYIFTRRLNIN